MFLAFVYLVCYLFSLYRYTRHMFSFNACCAMQAFRVRDSTHFYHSQRRSPSCLMTRNPVRISPTARQVWIYIRPRRCKLRTCAVFRRKMSDRVRLDGCRRLKERVRRLKCSVAPHLPTAVPGESWTQYSESELLSNLFHILIASYLEQFRSMRPQKDENSTIALQGQGPSDLSHSGHHYSI